MVLYNQNKSKCIIIKDKVIKNFYYKKPQEKLEVDSKLVRQWSVAHVRTYAQTDRQVKNNCLQWHIGCAEEAKSIYVVNLCSHSITNCSITIITPVQWPLFQDNLGKQVPER